MKCQFHVFLFNHFYFMYIGVFMHACLCEGSDALKCELLCGCWGLKEQLLLIITEPSLQSQSLYFLMGNFSDHCSSSQLPQPPEAISSLNLHVTCHIDN